MRVVCIKKNMWVRYELIFSQFLYTSKGMKIERDGSYTYM